MSAQKVIKIALAEVGYLEKATNSQLYDKTANAGNDNWTKYGAWYGLNGSDAPWCDMFVSWCADQAGEAAAVGKYASVWYHQQKFKELGRWHARGTYTPQPGDLIFFGAGDHIGLVEYVSGGRVYTIEGNTSGGSTLVANGGGVARKNYSLGYTKINGYGHPAYQSGTKTETKKYALGWHKDSKGWWYADSETSYCKDSWKQINGKWYAFDEEGYMMENQWKTDSTGTYYLGADGAMVTNRMVGIGADGKLRPMERYIHTLADVPASLRPETDALIAAGKLKGKGGSGEALVIDLPESALRAIIIATR